MTKDVLLSVRISQRLNVKLERLAKLTGRTKSWLVDSILAERVDPETRFAQSVVDAEEEMKRKGAIPHEEVVAWMQKKFAVKKVKPSRRAAE